MLTFVKSSPGNYVIGSGVDVLAKHVNEIISSISDGKPYDFISECNELLFQDIASRIVAAEFFKENDVDEEYLTVLITFTHIDKTYMVSLGKLPDPNDPSGPVKIVESRYVK